MITMTTSDYSRTDSGKSWKSQPDTVESETISHKQHSLLTKPDTLRWFRRLGGSEYTSYGYTSQGYLVTRLISCDPGRSIKRVRDFDFDGAIPQNR